VLVHRADLGPAGIRRRLGIVEVHPQWEAAHIRHRDDCEEGGVAPAAVSLPAKVPLQCEVGQCACARARLQARQRTWNDGSMTPTVLLMSIGLLGWWHVVVPLQVIVAAVALAHGRWRLAVFSLTALATAIILVVAARAAVDLHPVAFDRIGVVLPSGHSALVVAAVTTLAAMVWPRWSRGRVGAAVALILAVGWVMTKSGHTVGDVLVGLALGGVSVLVAGAVARIRRPRKISQAGATR